MLGIDVECSIIRPKWWDVRTCDWGQVDLQRRWPELHLAIVFSKFVTLGNVWVMIFEQANLESDLNNKPFIWKNSLITKKWNQVCMCTITISIKVGK